MPALPTILDPVASPKLFARGFAGPSWATWRCFLAALFALPLTDEEIYQRHTGRRSPPSFPAREARVVVGRRGGKSRIAALVAVFVACLRDHASLLASGERGTVMLIAADRKQARVLMRYVNGLLDSVAALDALVTRRTLDTIELSNQISIEIRTASFRSVHPRLHRGGRDLRRNHVLA